MKFKVGDITIDSRVKYDYPWLNKILSIDGEMYITELYGITRNINQGYAVNFREYIPEYDKYWSIHKESIWNQQLGELLEEK